MASPLSLVFHVVECKVGFLVSSLSTIVHAGSIIAGTRRQRVAVHTLVQDQFKTPMTNICSLKEGNGLMDPEHKLLDIEMRMQNLFCCCTTTYRLLDQTNLWNSDTNFLTNDTLHRHTLIRNYAKRNFVRWMLLQPRALPTQQRVHSIHDPRVAWFRWFCESIVK